MIVYRYNRGGFLNIFANAQRRATLCDQNTNMGGIMMWLLSVDHTLNLSQYADPAKLNMARLLSMW